MQDISVVLARVFAFLPLEDLNPHGRFFYPELVPALVERYGFLQRPEKPEDFNEEKGISFAFGRYNEVTIDSVKLVETGIAVDTLASTEDSEEILMDALEYVTQKFDLRFRPDMIKRKIYLSQLAFYSDAPLLHLNPVMDVVA